MKPYDKEALINTAKDELIKMIIAGFWYIDLKAGRQENLDYPTTWSDQFLNILGFTNENFPSLLSSWVGKIHPEDNKNTVEALFAHINDSSENTPFDIEYRIMTQDGSYLWAHSIGTTLRSETGNPLLFAGCLINITKCTLKNQEAEYLLTRLKLISLALTEAPWDMKVIAGDPINPNNEFWWSPQFRIVLGYIDETDFPNILSSWSESLHSDDKEQTLNALFEHLNDYSGQTPYSIDYRLRLKTGEYRWFHATGATVRDETGVPLRIAGTIRDIEHEKEQLRRSEEKLNRYSEIVNTLTKKQELSETSTLIGPQMQEMMRNIEKFAKVDAPVLITGESGVGKEVVADLIYNFSDRKAQPFLKINCGAIPDYLLESELFGYEEGSFSGAKKGGKIGFFELADNGTILLDEIGDLPLALQVKILRFVQSQDFYRIGGKRLIKVNTRIIAATNRDLEAMVLNKEFRSDLFYRLQVLTINIPPLRDRQNDIIPLTQYFLKKNNQKYQTSKTLSPEVYNIFINYSWKGNIRELENLIERLVVTTESNVITADYLPDGLKPFLTNNKVTTEHILSYKEAKEQFERKYFQQAIERFGSTRKVAENIKLDHSTIVKKAAKYGVDLLHWHKNK